MGKQNLRLVRDKVIGGGFHGAKNRRVEDLERLLELVNESRRLKRAADWRGKFRAEAVEKFIKTLEDRLKALRAFVVAREAASAFQQEIGYRGGMNPAEIEKVMRHVNSCSQPKRRENWNGMTSDERYERIEELLEDRDAKMHGGYNPEVPGLGKKIAALLHCCVRQGDAWDRIGDVLYEYEFNFDPGQ